MSAIYQRARPIRWEDIVGQEHVKDVLRSALEQGRVGHAYLFSGPRGVGKTTTARLIAMTANCTAPGIKPCGECESCLAVRSGNHPDVLEIDAASNNSVDDVRDLREKVGLAAMRGGKKIYILDEAHMMTRSAFNALLKTLEEPPSHVIFILATTEPEKIIPTILSRCQHYRFRRLTPEEIAGKLSGLVGQEGMTADPDALNLIGRLADGAMRDGESLLERMLAAGSAITRASVEDALGLPPGERVRAVAGALVMGDAGAAIAGAAQLYRDGFAARTVVEGLVAAFGAALHAELGLSTEGKLEGADVPRLLKLQAALDEQESRFARAADQQSLELALTHAILAVDSAPTSAGAGGSIPADLVQRLNRLEKELSTLRSSGARPAPSAAVSDFDPAARRGPAPVREVVAEAAATLAPAAPVQGNWADVTRQASMQLKAFLKPATMHAEAGYVSLSYEDKNAFHAKQVAAKFDDLGKLVLKVFGPVTFELIAPEGIRRKQKLGGNGGDNGGGAAASPVDPSSVEPSPVESRAVDPSLVDTSLIDTSLIDTSDTTQAQPSAARPAPTPPPSPKPERVESGQTSPAPAADVNPAAYRAAPAPTPTTAASTASAAPPPRRAAVATLERPSAFVEEADLPFGDLSGSDPAGVPERRVAPYSPDDAAAAPLPDGPPAAWEKEHVADIPPAPTDASGGDLVTPPGQSRELYVVEAITSEPDWDDIGGAVETSAAPLLEGARFAEYSAARPTAEQAPQHAGPRPASQPAHLASAPAAPKRPGDIRAHPLYDEVKSRFSGRVREMGKNRNYQAPSAAEDTEPGDEEAPDIAEA